MYSRMVLTLSKEDRTLLVQLAQSEERYPDQQLRHLIRKAAHARGLLPEPTSITAPIETKLVT